MKARLVSILPFFLSTVALQAEKVTLNLEQEERCYLKTEAADIIVKASEDPTSTKVIVITDSESRITTEQMQEDGITTRCFMAEDPKIEAVTIIVPRRTNFTATTFTGNIESEDTVGTLALDSVNGNIRFYQQSNQARYYHLNAMVIERLNTITLDGKLQDSYNLSATVAPKPLTEEEQGKLQRTVTITTINGSINITTDPKRRFMPADNPDDQAMKRYDHFTG